MLLSKIFLHGPAHNVLKTSITLKGSTDDARIVFNYLSDMR